ncbi:hypothetical protein ACA910_020932 [Epithemia clementina (nom. ined.)]
MNGGFLLNGQHNPNLKTLFWNGGIWACDHAIASNFWSWPKGSGIFFWRWPLEYMLDVAIGVAPLWIRKPKEQITRQKNLGDQAMIEKIADKINDVHATGYISEGTCVAMINFFAVPKGNSDIQMVYNGTKSGLNKCLFAPSIPLPVGDVLINTLDDGYWCIDNNYGEMFLSFWLHPKLQLYSGMDFTSMHGKGKREPMDRSMELLPYEAKPLSIRYSSMNQMLEMHCFG